MSVLIKMSLRGVVIILVVLFIRLLLKRLRIGHKYILGLWTMAFLYFVLPWKLSLPMGFWNSSAIPEGMGVVSRPWSVDERDGEAADTREIAYPAGIAGDVVAGTPDDMEKDTQGAAAVIPAEPTGQNIAGRNGIKDIPPTKSGAGGVMALIWLAGLTGLLGHMLYSYLALKRKLRSSVLMEDNIRWADDIDVPMVFGVIRPRIYLPISMESEDLSYVIAHERMHVKRKDGLLKISAYMVCLSHWFNPFIWLAYFLFGSDMEKACDEEVIRTMGRERRKEYAYALLRIAAENGTRKKRIFVAPICFDEGNVKSRIRNIMKYRYTLPGIGIAVAIVILLLSVVFLTEAKDSGAEEHVKTEEAVESEEAKGTAGLEASEGMAGSKGTAGSEGLEEIEESEDEGLPAFYVEGLDAIRIGESFSLEDFYITSRYTASNHYYIDEDGVLWGIGRNEFGQLGTGTYGIEEYHEEPVRIAENVISVDASWNDYFCIYLTEGGELYGIGLNDAEVLLGEGSESQVYSDYDFQRVTEPVLLMTDVAYARAGMECVAALQNNKFAYWWGAICSFDAYLCGRWLSGLLEIGRGCGESGKNVCHTAHEDYGTV